MRRMLIATTFASGVLTLSLQFGDFAHAHPASTSLVADQSSGSGQNGGRSGQRDAESSEKMQSNKGTQSSGGKVDPMDPPSNPSSGSNLRMQQNSGGTPTNPESNRTLGGSNDPLSDGNTVDPIKSMNPTTR